MKKYVNKTRLMKRIVFTDAKSGKPSVFFLRRGQVIESVDEATFVEDGIKVEVMKTAAKKTDSKDTDIKE